MFLFFTDETRRDPMAAQFTAHVNQMADDWSFGFDATQLASALEITVDELFDANSTLKLVLEQVEADTPTGEEARRKRYTFCVDNKETSLIIETQTRSGSA